MNKQELFENVLKECVSHDDMHKQLKHICTVGEYAYASDGHALLRIHKSLLDKVYTVPKKDGKYPNVESVINVPTSPCGAMDVTMMPPPQKEYEYNVAGKIISYKEYRRMFELSLMLGVNEWNVSVPASGKGGVHLNAEDDKVLLIVMPKIEKEKECFIVPICNSSEEGARINTVLGIKAYERIMKQRAECIKELKAQRKGNIYMFTIARYATMYVEAKDDEEAWAIARRDCDEIEDSDFEDPEPESMEYFGSVEREDLAGDVDDVYTFDGVVDIDEYFEESN